jgi:hypothetical protein
VKKESNHGLYKDGGEETKKRKRDYALSVLVFLCAFAKFRKVTISFIMSVCPSVSPYFRLHGTIQLPPRGILVKFYISMFFENPLRTFNFH